MARRRFSPPPQRKAGPPTRHLVLEPTDVPECWIGFVGDVSPLPGREARYDAAVHDFFEDCCVVVGNFEGVLTEQRWFPWLHKHTPRIFESLYRLKPPAHWVLSVANNHATDFGEPDLHATVNRFEREGLRWLGTQARPHLTLSDGLTLTAWTWWVNGPTEAVLQYDPGTPAEPGLHIALPHWGYEHERAPRADQRDRVPRGYDLIVGHHSHLPQPLEMLEDKRLVAWSLGNFLTAKRLPVLGEGALLKVGVASGKGGLPRVVQAHFQEVVLDRSDARYCVLRPRSTS
ncbi:MAG: CapA family protein [Rhodothermales bacterium]